MKKIVALLLSLNMLLVADTMLDGNPMDEVVPVIKEKLGIPKKLNDDVSLTDLYNGIQELNVSDEAVKEFYHQGGFFLLLRRLP
jgi:hypothetical protein